MSSNLSRDLAEAYNQILINEEQKYQDLLNEYVDYIFSDMVNEGYDITEEEVRQFCLDEGIPGWGAVKAFFGGAKRGAQEVARRQEVLARAKRIRDIKNATQNAQNLSAIDKAGEKVGSVVQKATSKKALATGTALGTAEFGASGQATGDGKSVAAAIPANIVGATSQAIETIGKPLTAIGYPGLEQIGTTGRKLGSWMSGSTNKNERNPYGLKKNTEEDVDLFDIIKGHLLDEGYAETEEAAHVIMSNMSEEWKKNIIDKVSEN